MGSRAPTHERGSAIIDAEKGIATVEPEVLGGDRPPRDILKS